MIQAVRMHCWRSRSLYSRLPCAHHRKFQRIENLDREPSAGRNLIGISRIFPPDDNLQYVKGAMAV